jgi:ribonuclease Z
MQLNDREFPLHIYGPKGMNKLTSQLLSLGYFKPNYKIISHEIDEKDVLDFDEYIIKIIRVKHGIPSLGFCFEEKIRPGKFNKPKALKLGVPEGPLFSKLQKGEKIKLKNGTKITPEMVLGKPRKGRKIVISGDTRPFENMIDFAKNADILIHEATFDTSLEEISFDYGHSTACQAAEIAKKAKVGKLYLTHISPRYNDCKLLEKEAQKIFNKSFVPNDFQDIEVKLKK